MKIHEALKNGIRRIYDPRWLEINSYILLPKMVDGRHGIWCKLFSEETQEMMKTKTPQEFPLYMIKDGLQSDCEEYKGPISKYDEDK